MMAALFIYLFHYKYFLIEASAKKSIIFALY